MRKVLAPLIAAVGMGACTTDNPFAGAENELTAQEGNIQRLRDEQGAGKDNDPAVCSLAVAMQKIIVSAFTETEWEKVKAEGDHESLIGAAEGIQEPGFDETDVDRVSSMNIPKGFEAARGMQCAKMDKRKNCILATSQGDLPKFILAVTGDVKGNGERSITTSFDHAVGGEKQSTRTTFHYDGSSNRTLGSIFQYGSTPLTAHCDLPSPQTFKTSANMVTSFTDSILGQ